MEIQNRKQLQEIRKLTADINEKNRRLKFRVKRKGEKNGRNNEGKIREDNKGSGRDRK